MTTIHDLIAAAQSGHTLDNEAELCPRCRAHDVLAAYAIAMAETLAKIAEFTEPGGMCEPDGPTPEARLADACLDKIVKGAQV